MTNPSGFLRGDPDEVGELLLQVARRERAPHAARERALARVAAVSVGAAVATTAKAALAAPGLTSSPGILAAKWLVIGLGGALVGLTAIDQAQRARVPAVGQVAPAAAVSQPVDPGVAQVLPALSLASPVVVAPAPNAARPAAPTVAVTPKSQAPDAADVPDAAETPVVNPSAVAFDAPSSAQLAREVAALRQARAALAQGKPGHALETLAAYHREFPVGVLGIEEVALRIEIAFAIGDRNAPELTRRFLAQYPTSPLATRVRALLGARSTSGTKP
jgi:hypothetical protein